MGNTNYFSGIVKILETPKQRLVTKQVHLITIRAQLSQNGKNQFVTLVFWGNLGRKIKEFYKLNDYILIEGYISIRKKRKFNRSKQNPKQVTITVLKVYPILLDRNKNLAFIEK